MWAADIFSFVHLRLLIDPRKELAPGNKDPGSDSHVRESFAPHQFVCGGSGYPQDFAYLGGGQGQRQVLITFESTFSQWIIPFFVILIWCSPFYPSQFLLPVVDSVSQPWRAHIVAHFASRISPLDGHSIVKVHERIPTRSRHRESTFYSHFLKIFHFQRNAQFQTVSHMQFDRREKSPLTR